MAPHPMQPVLQVNPFSVLRRHALRATGLLILAIAAPLAAAPVAGPNVSMVTGTKFPEGDPFATKQNEPSIAVSSRNPQHLLAASNDYRTVALSIAEGEDGGDAWISLYKSTNGGATWRTMLLAGCPLPIPQCAGGNTALNGLQFSADPVVRPGPYGTFFLSFIAGIRGASLQGVVAVQRFVDKNDNIKVGDDPFVADAFNVLDAGSKRSFTDKPWVVADVPGRPWNKNRTCIGIPGTSGPVPAFDVYVSYTNFTGKDPVNNPTGSQIVVAHSRDCGTTFRKPSVVSEDVKLGSGSALAIDPKTGTLYIAWRGYSTPGRSAPDAIYVARSGDGDEPNDFRDPVLVSKIKPFDQGTSTISFRVESLPVIAVSVDAGNTSRVHVAWAERKGDVNASTLACLAADGNCDARIRLATSSDGGKTFPTKVLVDDWSSDPINPANPGRGHQLHPALSFAAGKLALAWQDQRYDHTVGELQCVPQSGATGCTYPRDYREVRIPVAALQPCIAAGSPDCKTAIGQVFAPYIADTGLKRRHSLDYFTATADVRTDGTLQFGSSRLSQYRYGQVDVGGGVTKIRQLRFNFPNLPLYVNGTRPFIGDYTDLSGRAIVPSGGTFKFNTGIDAPFQAGGLKPVFHASWTDSRDVVPPKQLKADGSLDWSTHQPLFILDASGNAAKNAAACAPGGTTNTGQAGNRDQNVYTSQLGDNWTAYSGSPNKNLTTNGAAPRGFVVTVQNLDLSSTSRYRLSFLQVPANTTARFTYPLPGSPAPPATIDVDVAPRSTSSRNVWVQSTTAGASVTVLVTKLGTVSGGTLLPGPAGDNTQVALNADSTAVLLSTSDGKADTANNNLWYPNSGAGANGLTNSVVFNGLANNELANVELANIQLVNNDLANAELANVELANVELANAELANNELANNELANNELANNELANNELANNELANNELANNELANNELANAPIVETTVIAKNAGNTETTLAVKPLLRSLPAGARVSLVLRKIVVTPVIGTRCVPQLVERNAQVANIASPTVYTTGTIDSSFPDPASIPGSATLPLAPNELAQITLRITGLTTLTPDAAKELGKWGVKFVVPDAKPNTVTTVPLVIKTLVLPAVQANAVVAIPAAPNGLQALGGVPSSGLAWTIESITPQVGYSLGTGTITVNSASGDLTVSNVPPGKYDLIVSVRDCAASACSVAQQYDLQKLTLAVENIMFASPLPVAVAVGSSVALPSASSGTGDPVVYSAPTDPALAPQPNDCFVTSSGNPVTYTLTAGNVTGTCTVIASAGGATIQLSVNVTTTIAVKNAQSITFPTLAAPTFSPGGTFALVATASSGLAVSFSTTTTGVCTVSGSTVTIGSAGDCIIAADQAGNANYLPAPRLLQTVTISKAPQTISFAAVGPFIYAPGGSFLVGATSSSGLPVSFSSASPDICTANGATISILGAGICTVAADQAGNGNYQPAPQLPQPITIGRAPQSINFPVVGAQTYSPGGTFGVNATTSSGLAVSFSSATTGVCTVSGTTVMIVSAGDCIVAADQAGSTNYQPASQLLQTVKINKAAQSIAFPAPGPATYSPGGTFPVNASASSGLPVSFSSLSGSVCTVAGSTASIVTAGSCTIAADQAGNGNYLAATQVAQLITISKAAQTIAFVPVGSVTYSMGGTFTLSATSSSGLTVAFTSSPATVCTVAGNTVTIVSAGTCLVAADQPGSINYNPAPQATQTVTIGKASQTIAFPAVTAPTYAPGGTFAVSATASSGLAVTFSTTTTGICTVSGTTVTIVSAGACILAADQAGNGNYSPAPQVPQTVNIGKAAQTINFPIVPAPTYSPGGTVAISATALSGGTPDNLPVAFAASGNCSVSAPTLAAGVSSATVTLNGGGTCTLTASQAGNGNYSAAVPVLQSFSIAKASQTITFGALPDVRLPAAPFTVSAAASSGLAVAFSSLTAAICTVSGTTVTLVATGTCTIAADQPGNGNYNPAPQVRQGFRVLPSWSAAGSLLQPRSYHTATLLNDGKVLVAGGFDAGGASSATAESYDPGTGNFTSVGNLPSKSAGHTATLLSCSCASNGKVLLVGGGNASAGLYDPSTRAWTATGGNAGNRSFHTATTLSNGKVLLVGGADGSGKALGSSVIFDPASGSFANGPSLGVARERHVAIRLGDGRVLVAGGRAKLGDYDADDGQDVFASAEIYNPVTGTFTAAGNMVAGRFGASAVLLADGRVLVAGGSGDVTPAGASALASAEIYTPSSGLPGTWAAPAQTPVLATPRKDFTLTTLVDGRMLAAGGRNAAGGQGSAEFYTLAAGAAGAFSAAPPMLAVRSGHTATRLQDGRVLVVGGVGAAGTSISAAELFNSGP